MSIQELTDKLMLSQIEKLIEAAVLAEREACAKVCEDYIEWLHEMRDNDESLPQYQPELAGRQAGAGRCAAAIRARCNHA